MSVPYSLYRPVSLTADHRFYLPDRGNHIRHCTGALVRLDGRVCLCQRHSLSHLGVRRAILEAPHTASVKRLTGRTITFTITRGPHFIVPLEGVLLPVVALPFTLLDACNIS